MAGLSKGRENPSIRADLSCEELWIDPMQLPPLGEHAQRLYRTVETEIIPRLMLLHRKAADADAQSPVQKAGPALDASHVEAFTDHILDGHDPALAFVKALVARGVRLDALCLDLLAPSARRLGELWNADLCDFTDVTIGLGRLQALLRGLTASMPALRQAPDPGHSVLFAPVPGEQHTFGLTMVCDFFRTAGWSVWSNAPGDADALLDIIRTHHFDVVGFAIGSDRSIEALASIIRSVRQLSKNRSVRLLVGGPVLVDRPQVAALVGADATAPDARQAILAAQTLVAKRDEGR
jgi:MerR family transcriptional regulator, light-induced transcriptional regulator